VRFAKSSSWTSNTTIPSPISRKSSSSRRHPTRSISTEHSITIRLLRVGQLTARHCLIRITTQTSNLMELGENALIDSILIIKRNEGETARLVGLLVRDDINLEMDGFQ
jgi:hypothetical protein